MHNENINEFDENKEKLTKEELRKIKGMEDLSNKDADIMINLVYKISLLLYKHEYQ